MVVAVGIVLLLAFATVFDLYKGTRSGWFGPPERPAGAPPPVSAAGDRWAAAHTRTAGERANIPVLSPRRWFS